MFFAAVLLASSALAATTTFSCSRNYTIVAGDTCDGISRAVGASTYQLAMLNPTIDDACSNLQIGQPLCLGLTDGSDCTTTYTVAGGDSCDAITNQFAINSTLLFLNNPQIDSACDNIYVGEVLCVGNQLFTLPAAFTQNGGLNAPSIGAPVPGGQLTSSIGPLSSAIPAGNVAGAPTSSPGVTANPAPTPSSSSSTSSTPTSSSAAPTPTDDGDDECEDDENDD
ncbi:hypothetical protein DACRYDRAFT_23701 [Dacryopinax primogenitus]|uniref:LysM domain-containing protein n=1 Tax=Dacryopinax primogenitus (strain DJM 731) TaxID=1858805 RepID=M5G789_DACPD|nr:uncharacterized protein DACRYDRAFT_23701 [Dacryopinax primogenitus]EJT99627.1 hypothetical protein DACRYDRAFT_23701 [Dacryopinax primogenitus]